MRRLTRVVTAMAFAVAIVGLVVSGSVASDERTKHLGRFAEALSEKQLVMNAEKMVKCVALEKSAGKKNKYILDSYKSHMLVSELFVQRVLKIRGVEPAEVEKRAKATVDDLFEQSLEEYALWTKSTKDMELAVNCSDVSKMVGKVIAEMEHGGGGSLEDLLRRKGGKASQGQD